MPTQRLISKLPPKAAAILKHALIPKLNRYTNLPIALDLLKRKQITLLSPDTWEDRNDAFYLERYREELRFRCVLAVCFSTTSETFHHWRIFSHGASGICIEFDKAKLLSSLQAQKEIRHQAVEYHPLFTLQRNKPDIEQWPFIKRHAFKAESEYRIVYESKKESLRAMSLNIDLTSIRMITLSPWLAEHTAASVIDIIKSIDGCSGIKVNRSSLIDNAGWRDIIK